MAIDYQQYSAKLCDQCKTTGLPILPVRYTVVPKNVKATLPKWASGDRIKSVKIGSEFHYALRTLRTGFVYLFYQTNARGSMQWECYSVSPDGCLRLQPSPQAARRQDEEFHCKTHGPENTVVNYIVIEQPEKCGATWIAFSEIQWSEKTIQEYTTNSAFRNARMQTLYPAEMAKGTKHSHGAIASAEAIKEVIEYSGNFSRGQWPHDSVADNFTYEDGSYDKTHLSKTSTRYPWYQRQGRENYLLWHMNLRATTSTAKHTPHVLALWDAVGIAQELNGFRNDAAGWIQKYGSERAMQITAANAIAGLEKALPDAAEADVEAKQALAVSATRSHQTGPAGPAALRKQAIAKNDPRYAEAADLHEQWEPQDVPHYYISRIDSALYLPPAAWRSDVDKTKADVKAYLASRGPNHEKAIKDAREDSWKEYKEKINFDSISDFNGKWKDFQRDIDLVIDRRTATLVKWLEAPLFVEALEDYHPTDLQDGVMFEDLIGEITFGMGSSPSGRKKINEWIKEAKASVKGNLLWRAIALNQQGAIPELDQALAAAKEHQERRTVATALNTEGTVAKILKGFADTCKKAASLNTTNIKAASEKGTTAFGIRIKPTRTFGIDRIGLTVGNLVFGHFQVPGLADYLSEKIIQHIFSIRAFVDVNDSKALIVAQAEVDPTSRMRLIKRLETAKTFLEETKPEIKTAQTASLDASWRNFKNTNPNAADTVRDARLSVVVMLIEYLNFQKILGDCALKNDGKSWILLSASAATISSGLFDVASAPAKSIFGDDKIVRGTDSWTNQKLKLFGGALSLYATMIGAIFDYSYAVKNGEQGNRMLAALYSLKAFLGGANVLNIAYTTYSYSAPAIARLTAQEAVYEGAARGLSARAVAAVASRTLLMSLGTWITVGTLGIQCLIWYYDRQKLRWWCESCAFEIGRAHV